MPGKASPTPDEYARMWRDQRLHAVRLLGAQRTYLNRFQKHLLAEVQHSLEAATENIDSLYGDPDAIRHRRETEDDIAAYHAIKHQRRN